MIDGITILNQSPIEEPSSTIIIIAALAALFLGLMISLTLDIDYAFPLTICLILGAVAIASESTSMPTGRYEYECTISDDVSLTEFSEYYELVSQRDGIYVIRDKEVHS